MTKKILLLQFMLLALGSCQNKAKQENSTPTTTSETSATTTPPTSNPVAAKSEVLPPPQDAAEAPTAAPAVVYPDLSPTLTIKTLWCDQVTDAPILVGRTINDEDEVYLLVGGKASDGTSYEARLPQGTTWSLEKKGGAGAQSIEANDVHKYGPLTIPWPLTLKNGQSAEMTILWMEEDKAGADERLAAASRIARETNPDDQRIGAIATIGELLGAILGSNHDDFMGALAVRITNDKGTLKTEWQAKEYCTDVGSTANGQRFDFGNAGGAYKTTLEVK